MSKVTAASVRGSAWPERLGHLPEGSWGCGWGGEWKGNEARKHCCHLTNEDTNERIGAEHAKEFGFFFYCPPSSLHLDRFSLL